MSFKRELEEQRQYEYERNKHKSLIREMRLADEDYNHFGYSDEYYLSQILAAEKTKRQQEEAAQREREAEIARLRKLAQIQEQKRAEEARLLAAQKQTEHDKEILEAAERNFERGCLKYAVMANPDTYNSILRYPVEGSVVVKIAKVITESRLQIHRIDVVDEVSFKAALWLCQQPEVKTLKISDLTSSEYFQKLLEATTKNTTLEFFDLNVSDDLFSAYLLTRPENLYLSFDAEKNAFSLEVKNDGESSFRINAVQDVHVERVNRMLDARPESCDVRLSNGSFHPALNIARPNVRGITLENQRITSDHVSVLKRFSDSQLHYFRAVKCEFDSAESSDAFICAVLKNQALTTLYLENCKLVENDFQLIEKYAETHVQLVKINVGSNPLSKDTCDSITRLVTRNKRFMEWNKKLDEIAGTTDVEARLAALAKLKSEFDSTPKEEFYQPCFDRYTGLFNQGLALYSNQVCVDDINQYWLDVNALRDLVVRFNLSDTNKKQMYQHIVDRVLGTKEVPPAVLLFHLTIRAQEDLLGGHENLAFQSLDMARNMRGAVNMREVIFIAEHSQNPEDFLHLAECYLNQKQQTDELDYGVVKCLSRISSENTEFYRKAEDNIMSLMRLRATRILGNKLTPFQRKLIEDLHEKMTVRDMITTLHVFITKIPFIPVGEKAVDGAVKKSLLKLLSDMRAMGRVDLNQRVVASAPAKEKLLEDEAAEQEKKAPQDDLEDELREWVVMSSESEPNQPSKQPPVAQRQPAPNAPPELALRYDEIEDAAKASAAQSQPVASAPPLSSAVAAPLYQAPAQDLQSQQLQTVQRIPAEYFAAPAAVAYGQPLSTAQAMNAQRSRETSPVGSPRQSRAAVPDQVVPAAPESVVLPSVPVFTPQAAPSAVEPARNQRRPEKRVAMASGGTQ